MLGNVIKGVPCLWLFVDNEIGGAAATGLGEEVLKTVGSFLIVELMRQGKSPQEACEEAISRIVKKPNSDFKNFQVCYIAVNKQGEVGAYSIHEWFSYNLYKEGVNKNIKTRQRGDLLWNFQPIGTFLPELIRLQTP